MSMGFPCNNKKPHRIISRGGVRWIIRFGIHTVNLHKCIHAILLLLYSHTGTEEIARSIVHTNALHILHGAVMLFVYTYIFSRNVVI